MAIRSSCRFRPSRQQGIEDLLEAILLVADNMDIKANPKGKVIGTVIEAELDRAKGVMATLLVQNGTLKVGDVVVAGTAYGRLRAMFDYRGRKLRKAGPSTPVSVMGLNEVPQAGDLFQVVDSEREARVDRAAAQQARRAGASQKKAHITLEQLFDRFQAGEMRELRLIVKADVQGSLEPIVSSLNDLRKGEININILHAETGNIGENDVMLAAASKAIVIGFNVQADAAARRLAEAEGVSIRLYDIIYRLTRRYGKSAEGHAGAGDERDRDRPRRSARGIPHLEGWQHCRLPGDRWRNPPKCPHAGAARRQVLPRARSARSSTCKKMCVRCARV